jgi:uncharacterized repeat protein (TIGR02543 family)
MKKNAFLLFSAVLCAVVLSFSGCDILSNPDKGSETYTVTFSANAGTDVVTLLPASLTGISAGSKITAPAGTPARSGYIFVGWYKESSCTTKWNFESDTVSSSVTLYASWTAYVTYTVTFDANAGTDTVTSLPESLTDIASGSKITEPAASPVRSGYIFGGWYKESTAAAAWNFSSDTVGASVTLYARWLSEDSYCVITFDTGTSGWNCEPLIAEKGTTANIVLYYEKQFIAYILTDPDYTDDYVYTDSEYKNSTGFSFSHSTVSSDPDVIDYSKYTVNKSVTLYVKMIPRYAVTIYPDGGKFADSSTGVKTVKMADGNTVSDIDSYIAKPTRSGYVFSHWTSDESGTAEVAGSTEIHSNLSLYAQWTDLYTDMKGWWLYTNANGSKCFMNLDPAEGTGIIYDTSVADGLRPCTVTDTKITVSSDNTSTYTYTYADGVLTFNSIACTRPSEKMTAGGTGSGSYLVINSLFLLNTSDYTCTLTSTENTNLSVSGKWSGGGSSLCLLDGDSNLVMQFSGAEQLDYNTLGSRYYNYSGSTSCNTKDAYSLYLGKDGTYHFYVFSQDVQGSWYASSSGTTTYVYLSGGYGNSFKESIEYDGTSFTTSGSTEHTLVQASAKGTVSEFSEDTELTGTWSYRQSNATAEYTFTSDGIQKLYNSFNGNKTYDSYYYADKQNSVLYSLNTNMPQLLEGITGTYPYSINSDGTKLTLSGNGQTAVFTKK